MMDSMTATGHIFKYSHKTDAAAQPSSLPPWWCLKGCCPRLLVLSTLYCFELPTLLLTDYHSCHTCIGKNLSYSASNNISQAESSSRKNWHVILRMKIGTNMKLYHLWSVSFLPWLSLPSFPKLQNISWVKSSIFSHFVLIKWWDALSYCCEVRSWHDSFSLSLCWIISEDFFLP